MQRITITMDEDLVDQLDEMIELKGYSNRSEALRDLAREGMKNYRVKNDQLSDCIGVLSYIYDHEARELAKRLTATHHEHHNLTVASMHIHLDKDYCLEVSLLRGGVKDVKHFSDLITSQRAVVHGELAIIPVNK
ncbi:MULTISPECIES: nickel-responsive transcriptional regulator NikR [Paenochrobactrum]|uniref:nickel-responsive transcriptional regulator NikR n=1 Tax=Paenochrobactrum pullorum TaxID=1324351 RepID=UPI0035BC0F75